jgi:hypothetical protein
MKSVIIKNKQGIQIAQAAIEDPVDWIAEGVAGNWWGKPERLVPHKDEPLAEPYDDADVLEERIITDDLGQDKKFVKLQAEYTIHVEDISSQYALEQVLAKRKAEYPGAEEFLNAYFDGGPDALGVLQMKRLQIKAKYPKPGA